MAERESLLKIDGSHGEGGGALLRTALQMSVLTQQGFRIEHIRSGTKFIGLDVEDITLIKILASLTDAEVSGAEPGSLSLLFVPTRTPKLLKGTVKTERNENGRGSNALVIASSLIPILATAGGFSEFTVEGETYSNNSMSFDYFAGVVGTVHRKQNLFAALEIEKAAYNREAEGTISVEVEPGNFAGLKWADRGRPKLMRAVISYSGFPHPVAERCIAHLQKLAQSARQTIDADVFDLESDGPGMHCTVWTQYENGVGGSSASGTRTLRAEQLAHSAFERCFEWMTTDASLDPITAEHALLPACLASESSEFKVSELTSRFLTAIWVIKQFSPVRITVKGSQGGFGHVSITR